MSPPPRRTESLDELAIRHRTDKSSRQHGYADLYDRHLAPLRDTDVTVLEIGVQDGASLRMWRDYFPRGRIFGIDVDPACARHRGDRVEVMTGSQRDAAFLAAVVERTGPLDLVVDDGSHRFADQRRALMRLWPHVTPGGTYIVEDVHTSYWARFGMSYRQRDSTVELLKDLVDDIHDDLHEHAPTLPDVGAVQFAYCTCLIVKRTPPRPPRMQDTVRGSDDASILGRCPGCGVERPLTEHALEHAGRTTTYRCPACGAEVASVERLPGGAKFRRTAPARLTFPELPDPPA